MTAVAAEVMVLSLNAGLSIAPHGVCIPAGNGECKLAPLLKAAQGIMVSVPPAEEAEGLRRASVAKQRATQPVGAASTAGLGVMVGPHQVVGGDSTRVLYEPSMTPVGSFNGHARC